MKGKYNNMFKKILKISLPVMAFALLLTFSSAFTDVAFASNKYNITYLNQGNYTNGYSYNGKTFKVSSMGCGLTSLAMAYQGFTGNSLNPETVLQNMINNKYLRADGGDVYNADLAKECNEWGISCEWTSDQSKAINALQNNCMVIFNVGPTSFTYNGSSKKLTNCGHYILLANYNASTGKALVYDPNGNNNLKGVWVNFGAETSTSSIAHCKKCQPCGDYGIISYGTNIDNIYMDTTSVSLGSSCNIRGTLTAPKGNIKRIDAAIVEIRGTKSTYNQAVNCFPNCKTVNLANTVINMGLKFAGLHSGTYDLHVCVTDDYGAHLKVIHFKVGSGVWSNMSFNSVNFAVSFKQGVDSTLKGTITSNYKITRVDAAIINRSNNTIVASVCYYPNTTSVNLNGYLNTYFRFDKLAKGNYRLDITATDASKNVVPIQKFFAVK